MAGNDHLSAGRIGPIDLDDRVDVVDALSLIDADALRALPSLGVGGSVGGVVGAGYVTALLGLAWLSGTSVGIGADGHVLIGG